MRVYTWIGLAFGVPLGVWLDDIIRVLFNIDIGQSLMATAVADILLIGLLMIAVYALLPLRCDVLHRLDD